jgi:hypothetical protein
VLEKLGLTREDLGAIGAVPHGTAQTALLIDRTRSMVRDIADVVGGKAAPKLTRAGVLDEATQHAAARQYVPALIEDLLAKVFPDKYQDHAAMERTIDIIKKDNILGGYDDAVRELLRLNGTAGPTSAEAQAQAAFVKDIATAQNIPQLDAEVRASLNTDVAQDVKRWETHVSSLMDNLYNELKLANPGTPRETRGRHYAARMNLLPLHEEARISSFSDQNQPLPEIATSNYRNPNMKHDKFMRKAALTGEYSSDPTAVLLNSLGGRINEVTKLRFYQALERTGVGMIEDSFDPSITEIGGKPAARMPIKYPETDPKTGRTRMVEKSLYVQKELVPEIRGILNTDGRVTTNPILAAITKVQMLQLADASAHIKNIHTTVLNALGSTHAGVTTILFLQRCRASAQPIRARDQSRGAGDFGRHARDAIGDRFPGPQRDDPSRVSIHWHPAHYPDAGFDSHRGYRQPRDHESAIRSTRPARAGYRHARESPQLHPADRRIQSSADEQEGSDAPRLRRQPVHRGRPHL